MSSITPPQVKSTLIGAILHSAFYGVFAILCTSSIYLMVLRRRQHLHGSSPSTSTRSSLNIPILYGAVALFLVVTANWIFAMLRLFLSLVPDTTDGSTVEFVRNYGSPIELVETGLVLATIVIGDLIVIYRTWVIWSYQKAVAIFPLLCILALMGCAIATSTQLSSFTRGETVFRPYALRWSAIDLGLTFLVNVYCLIMIAIKLRTIESQLKKHNLRSSISISSLLAIFIESAMIYTCWSIFALVCALTRSPLNYITEESIPAVSGIASTLISSRVGLGWASDGQGDMVQHDMPGVEGGSQDIYPTFSVNTHGEDTATVADDGVEEYPLEMFTTCPELTAKMQDKLPRIIEE